MFFSHFLPLFYIKYLKLFYNLDTLINVVWSQYLIHYNFLKYDESIKNQEPASVIYQTLTES